MAEYPAEDHAGIWARLSHTASGFHSWREVEPVAGYPDLPGGRRGFMSAVEVEGTDVPQGAVVRLYPLQQDFFCFRAPDEVP